MFGTKILIATRNTFNKLIFICLAVFLLYCQNYPFIINSNQFYKIILPVLLIIILPEIITKIIHKRESKLRTILTPEQYDKISTITQKQNKSVDQFCIEAINEKLDKSI